MTHSNNVILGEHMKDTHKTNRTGRNVPTVASDTTVTADRPIPKIILLAALLILATTALAPTYLSGQSTPDMQKAREETAVVYDLGRFFGYVHGMTTENRSLALTTEQKREIKGIMDEIRDTSRIEPSWAARQLEYLELDLLTPAQLMEVDRRAMAWQNSRETSSEGGGGTGGATGAAGGSGSGPLSTYAAGGPFNPIVDATRTIGQGFQALYDHIK
jgi:hypothetical protein